MMSFKARSVTRLTSSRSGGRQADLIAHETPKFTSWNFSLPFRCNKVDAGRWRRPRAYDGLLRSVQDSAVAALCCCAIAGLRVVAQRLVQPDVGLVRHSRTVPAHEGERSLVAGYDARQRLAGVGVRTWADRRAISPTMPRSRQARTG